MSFDLERDRKYVGELSGYSYSNAQKIAKEPDSYIKINSGHRKEQDSYANVDPKRKFVDPYPNRIDLNCRTKTQK